MSVDRQLVEQRKEKTWRNKVEDTLWRPLMCLRTRLHIRGSIAFVCTYLRCGYLRLCTYMHVCVLMCVHALMYISVLAGSEPVPAPTKAPPPQQPPGILRELVYDEAPAARRPCFGRRSRRGKSRSASLSPVLRGHS